MSHGFNQQSFVLERVLNGFFQRLETGEEKGDQLVVIVGRIEQRRDGHDGESVDGIRAGFNVRKDIQTDALEKSQGTFSPAGQEIDTNQGLDTVGDIFVGYSVLVQVSVTLAFGRRHLKKRR